MLNIDVGYDNYGCSASGGVVTIEPTAYTATMAPSTTSSLTHSTDNNHGDNINSAGGVGNGGLTQADMIALGVGLGIGLPSLIVSIITCLRLGHG